MSPRLDFLHTDSTASRWYLAQPSPVVFGAGKTTSIGTTPSIGWVGTPTVTAPQIQITVSNGVPGKPSLALWSAWPASTPFANATLWLAAPLHRFAPTVLDPSGAASYAFPIAPALRGETRVFQVWMRDPLHPDGTGVGLSDALCVRFF